MDTQDFLKSLDVLVETALSRIAASAASGAGETPGSIEVNALLRMALRNELEAAEEAAVWLVSETDTEVKLSLMRQCGDEAKHYRLVEAHLRSRGDTLEGFDPMAKGYTPMFELLRSLTTTVERIAAGPFAREALAQVKNQSFIDFLTARGEVATAALYRDEIQPDEAHHHALGRKLLARFATTDDSQRLAKTAVERTLTLAGELQEIARLKLGITSAPGC